MANDADSPIDLAQAGDFNLGPLRVCPSLRVIRVDGDEQVLEPRVMQVLVSLAGADGAVVSRDEMIRRCWNGVVVGDDAIQRCIGRIRRVAEATGAFDIETVPKVGYRLLVKGGAGAAATDTPGPAAGDTSGRPPSVVFAEVETLSPRSQDEVFAQLLADDVTAALSHNRDITVAMRTGPVGDAEVAADFLVNVQLVRTDDRARLRIQLIASEDRHIVMAAQFDNPDMSGPVPTDDLVISIAHAVYAAMTHEATSRALKKQQDLSAWEAVIRSYSAYQRIGAEGMEFAITEAKRAVELDPGFGAAHAALSLSSAGAYEVGGGVDKALAEQSRRHANLALGLDPDNPIVLASVGSALGMVSRPPEGYELCQRAAAIAPNHPLVLLYMARQHLYRGEAEAAISALETHARVAPHFPWQYYIAFQRGLAEYMAGRQDQAERWYDRASVLNPGYPFSWIAKTILCELEGRHDEAARHAERVRGLEGEGSLELQLARIGNSYPDPEAAAYLQSLFAQAWGGDQGSS